MVASDNLVVLKAIREAQPGHVLVIDAKGETNQAVAGDFVLGMAQTLGINGVIRDIIGTKELNYPIFCNGSTITASGKSGEGDINVPISCGGVTIHLGDIIVGDADGVVVIPQEREREDEILEKSLEKVEKDRIRSEMVSGDKKKIIEYLDRSIS